MSISKVEVVVPLATGVETSEDELTVSLADGRRISVPLVWFPRLLDATTDERAEFRLIGGGEGIHWPRVDEDISVAGLLRGSHARRSFPHDAGSRVSSTHFTASSPARPMGYVLCRYLAALLLLLYGFAKITGAQFTILDSELDKPLRDVSGFWLTWYYFGYSQVYGTIVALVQVGGAVALLIRRTALIGALVLFPVIGNIILIDIFYAIDLGALLAALAIAACLTRVIAEHRHLLPPLLLPPQLETTRGRQALAASGIAAVVLLSFSFLYYVANHNNRAPTPIDGTWIVAAETPESLQLPTHVYFERNRAAMCVFRYADRFSTHHFEVNRDQSAVKIWTTWLAKGPLLLEGTYDAARSSVVLTGRLPESPEAVTFRLTNRKPPTGAVR